MCVKNFRTAGPLEATGNRIMENHAVSSLGAGIIIFHQQRVLLVQMNYGNFRGHWILPGGSVEAGEHPGQTALRELQEETALQAKLSDMVAVRHRIHSDGTANVYYVFRGELLSPFQEAPEQQLQWPREELIEARFWPIQEAITDPMVRNITRSFIARAAQVPPVNRAYELEPDYPANDEIFGI